MASVPQTDPILDLLKRSKTIAVVGLSNSPLRPSHGVSAYMQTHGYRIIPVNPKITEALGEKSYPSLLDVPEKIDIVNIFRRPEFVEEIVAQAIQRKVPVIWMQEASHPRKSRGEGAPGRGFRGDGPLHFERTQSPVLTLICHSERSLPARSAGKRSRRILRAKPVRG